VIVRKTVACARDAPTRSTPSRALAALVMLVAIVGLVGRNATAVPRRLELHFFRRGTANPLLAFYQLASILELYFFMYS